MVKYTVFTKLKTDLHFKVHGIPISKFSKQLGTVSIEDVHTPDKNQIVSQFILHSGMDCPIITITPLDEHSTCWGITFGRKYTIELLML